MKLLGTTIVLSTLLATNAGASSSGSSALPKTKRLRTKSIYKSSSSSSNPKASSSSHRINENNDNHVSESERRLKLFQQRKLQSFSFPAIKSFSFSSLNSMNNNIISNNISSLSMPVVAVGDEKEEYDPFLGMGSVPLVETFPVEEETGSPISSSPTSGSPTSTPSASPSKGPSDSPVTEGPTESPSAAAIPDQTPKPTMKKCSFCQASGVTAPEDFVIPDAAGVTCGQAALYAGTIQEDDSIFSTGKCTELKQAEFICCPTKPKVPCGFCVNDDDTDESGSGSGITVEESLIVVPNSNGTTCGLTSAYAASLEGDTEECRMILMAEGVCCPDFDVACSFCPDGLTVDPEYVLPDEDGTTCGMALGYAPTISAEDEMCATMQFAEMFCCPGVDVDVVVPDEDVVMSMSAIMSMSMSMMSMDLTVDSGVITTMEPTEPPAKSDPITSSPDDELSASAPTDPITSPDPDGSTGSPTQKPVETPTPIPPTAPSPRLAPSSAMALGTSSLLVALMLSATIAGLNLL